MPNFSIDRIESLDYDFTGWPTNDGKGMCSGKGTIPEPSQKDLETYQDGIKELYGLKDDESAEKAIDKSAKEEDDDDKIEKLLELTSTLCKGTPSKAELLQLPPRLKIAFLKWIYKELGDPEV